ncbi:cytochrome c oxidase subunit 4 [Desertivibrio insolitus]|uniref:cytochrome c oxidase subunit 4 n=1 Tax=Herbiconiux sp. SYSU D00978 TaxID=2812562 RepID=UPI001A9663BE|nr:cytochrome c oxidase subunit 4 [Herbiconiux sp. SYSU D00978]
MKANAVLFWILSVIFAAFAVAYGWWHAAEGLVQEPVGLVALSLSSVFAMFLGFYTQRSYNSFGGELPEDRLDAEIDDGDPELGHFSPWSWWPITLAGAGALVFLGLAVGAWISMIGFTIFVVAIVGWVYEYYRGYFAH